jgi:hypothetical protein
MQINARVHWFIYCPTWSGGGYIDLGTNNPHFDIPLTITLAGILSFHS